ncbi:beta strand repeat-containing protein [Posidoniimonas polymericola]|uniref:beta strand repeat-containing protein n=1 Tax=Posidoniimonas polymericola TaxID=2528002 RepID=UPI0018D2B3DE|nr:choice-of-anchor D domain-containing protein [Posidoniimonas polymericola]
MLLSLAATGLGADLTSIWDNGAGDWSDKAHWDSANFPNNGNGGLTFDAVVGGGEVSVDQPIAIEVLHFSAGAIGGSDPLNLSSLAWSGGVFNGTGVVTAAGGVIDAGYGGAVYLDGAALHLTDDLQWSRGFISYLTARGTIEVASGATLAKTTLLEGWNYHLDANLAVESGGSFLHDSDETTYVYGALLNNGTLHVEQGVLSLQDSLSGSGQVVVNAGGTLQLYGGSHTPGNDFSGAGTVQFSGGDVELNGVSYAVGTTVVDGGVVAFNTGGPLSIGGIDLGAGAIGGSDALNLSSLAWSGGVFNGTGVVTAAGGLIDTGYGGAVYLDGTTLRLTDDLQWGRGFITYQTARGSIEVASGATLAKTTLLEGWNYHLDANLDVEEGAQFLHDSDETTYVYGTLLNNGTLHVEQGVLSLQDSLSGSGQVVVNAGGTLQFYGGSHTPGNDFSGAGTVQFSGGDVELNGVSYVVGTTAVDGGAVAFNTGGPLSIGGLDFGAGTIGGSDPLNLTSLTWSGGLFNGTGVVTAAGGLIDTGYGGAVYLDATTLRLTDDLQWSRGFITYQTARGSIEVASGATLAKTTLLEGWNYHLDANLAVEEGAQFLHDSDETTYSYGTLLNNGTLHVEQGVLSLYGELANYEPVGGVLTDGTYRIASTLQFQNAAIATNRAAIELVGPGSAIVDQADQNALSALSLNDTGASLRLLGGRGFSTSAALTNRGAIELTGGTLTAASLINASAGSITGFGSVAQRPNNSGLLKAVGGVLALENGVVGTSGKVEAATGGTVSVSAGAQNSTANQLTIRSGGMLALGVHDFSVAGDFLNEDAGVGNGFAPRTGVTGTGKILAPVGVTQSIVGDVTGGGAGASATLAFGNIHVGGTATATYRVQNNGSGPLLRGAVQTSVNGASVTDPRLTGSGVTPGNFAPIVAGGNSPNYAVTFTASSAGALAGQKVHVANNYDNVSNQLVEFSGAAYRLASPSAHAPEPVALPIVHIGDTAQQTLSLTNTAAADGFSESLDAAFAGVTGAATAAGSISLLAPGAAESSSLVVGLDTSTAGVKSGTATISLTSNGAGSSGLGATALGTQTVNIQGQVNHYAAPAITKVAGAGTLSPIGPNSYLLDLGLIPLAGVGAVVELGVLNDALAPADELAGDWSLAASGFVLGQFTSFAGLMAGESITGPTVSVGASIAQDLSGTITLLPLSENASGYSGQLTPVSITVQASVVLAGDFNDDGVVNAADYTTWRDNLGAAAGVLPNDIDGGAIGVAQYNTWKTHYGQETSTLASASTAAVPEPAATLLLGVLACMGLKRRTRSGR